MTPDQAYQDGYDARKYDRATLRANPHPITSDLWTAWVDGWLDRRDWERRTGAERGRA
jgi:hypothetical protein